MNTYQSIIIDISNFNLKESLEYINNFLENEIHQLNENATLWIICNNSVDNDKNIQPIPFIISRKILSNDLKLKNIIIWPNFNNPKPNELNAFIDITTYILFFIRNKDYFINIDPIREKHIWKDVEWGKRKKNYNEKGKNPGNFWLKTEDDGEGHITKHLPLNYKDVIERIIKCSSKENDYVLLKNIEEIDNMPTDGVDLIYEK